MKGTCKKIGIIAVLSLLAALAMAGCASAPAGGNNKGAAHPDSFMDQGRGYERSGNYTAALAAYSVAKATSEITEAQLAAEFARLKTSLGATKFNDDALAAADFCTKQSDIASKEENNSLQALLWTMAALDLTMAVE
jgi:hypothetical protein